MQAPPADLERTITAEIVRSALAVAVEEASIVVVRSSHSLWIQEGADAAGALLDVQGELVAQSSATTLMHGASLRCCGLSVLEDIAPETMAPGDVYALNDPYRGGIHANDIAVFRPIFAGGRPRWLGATLIHVADLGGVAVGGLAALANDTFAEGVLLPPLRLFRRGAPNDDVFAIIERNSRVPSKVVGDVKALVAGANVVARRVEELVERYGADELERHVAEYLDYTERRMREDLRRIPSGTYRGAFTVDSDGVDPDRSFEVTAAVTVADGGVTVDLSDSAAQSQGAVNASYSQTLSGVIYAVRCLVDPSIPMNEGCFRVVEAVLPPGSVVNPHPPAACGGRLPTVTAVVDAILQAMSAAMPDRGVAPSGVLHVWTLAGAGAADGGERWLNLFYEFGGIGARHGSDGPDATGAFFLGGRSVIPQVEPLEAQMPLVEEWSRLLPDSGGPGRWRGGLGVEVGVRMLAPAELTVRGDRVRIPPAGTAGGAPGRAGGFWVRRTDGVEEHLAAKQTGVRLGPGDLVVVQTSGGGGLGPAFERDPQAVLADVLDGKVSPDAARRDYGVAVDAVGGVVDGEETSRLRAQVPR